MKKSRNPIDSKGSAMNLTSHICIEEENINNNFIYSNQIFDVMLIQMKVILWCSLGNIHIICALFPHLSNSVVEWI